MARGNYRFMAKYSDHYTRFKAIYFISTKDTAVTTLIIFVQAFVMPAGPRLLHLRVDGGGEFIADYYRDYLKTIGSDTLYCRMLGKHVDLSFLRTSGTRPHGVIQLFSIPFERFA